MPPPAGSGTFGVPRPRRCGRSDEESQGPVSGFHHQRTPPEGAAAISRDPLIDLFSGPRTAPYLARCGGDVGLATRLYRWNGQVASAFQETGGHLEVALRNGVARELERRHRRLGRPGAWWDDPARELNAAAHQAIGKARTDLRKWGKPVTGDYLVTALGFGFWRYLLTTRYTSTLWPSARRAFPHLPGKDRKLVERQIGNLHRLRNRTSHGEPVWHLPLHALREDLYDVMGYLSRELVEFAQDGCRIEGLLDDCPVER